MNIEIQRRTEPLNEGYGAALRFADGAEFRRAADQRCKYRLDENIQYISY